MDDPTMNSVTQEVVAPPDLAQIVRQIQQMSDEREIRTLLATIYLLADEDRQASDVRASTGSTTGGDQ